MELTNDKHTNNNDRGGGLSYLDCLLLAGCRPRLYIDMEARHEIR